MAISLRLATRSFLKTRAGVSVPTFAPSCPRRGTVIVRVFIAGRADLSNYQILTANPKSWRLIGEPNRAVETLHVTGANVVQGLEGAVTRNLRIGDRSPGQLLQGRLVLKAVALAAHGLNLGRKLQSAFGRG